MQPATPEQVSEEFAAAINAGDAGRAAALFAADASYLTADGRVAEGRPAIREALDALIRGRPRMAVEIERLIETPRGAVGSECWTLTFEGEGEWASERSGRSTVVFARAPEGWEILIGAARGLAPAGHAQEVEDLSAAARRALARSRCPLERLLAREGLDRAGGLFAICAGAGVWRELGLGDPPDGRPLYVGKALGGIPSRSLKAYAERAFRAQSVSDTSLRRSLAALLAERLGVIAIPRGLPEGAGDRRWKYFALEEDGDRRLTEWMLANLEVAVWVAPPRAPVEEVCTAVRRASSPPLNLLEVVTPWTKQLKAARAELATKAKERLEKEGPGAETPEG